jgi:hypothetical protein
MSETAHVKSLMAYGNSLGCLLLRNNSGGFQDKTGRWVFYGLGNEGRGKSIGSSDLIGPMPVLIRPEHVGLTLGVMVCAEVKIPADPRSKPTVDQLNFIAAMNAAGCRAGIVRTPSDLDELLKI